MENATDALKMMFAVFAFIVALSITLNSLTKTRETADAVLYYSDETNYYDYTDSSDQTKGREVTKDAIIATLFRKQTDTYIIVDLKSTNTKYVFDYMGKVTEINRTTNTVIRRIDTNEAPTTGATEDYRYYKINFINNTLRENKTYYENVSEVTNKSQLGGEYVIADDGTKLQVVQGDNKVIIMYTEK